MEKQNHQKSCNRQYARNHAEDAMYVITCICVGAGARWKGEKKGRWNQWKHLYTHAVAKKNVSLDFQWHRENTRFVKAILCALIFVRPGLELNEDQGYLFSFYLLTCNIYSILNRLFTKNITLILWWSVHHVHDKGFSKGSHGYLYEKIFFSTNLKFIC